MNSIELYNFIYTFPCKSKYGFNQDEINFVLSTFDNINMDKYYDAMTGNTCVLDNELIITYRCDLLLGLKCGLENRNPKMHEFD
jgi:hypothetical protein